MNHLSQKLVIAVLIVGLVIIGGITFLRSKNASNSILGYYANVDVPTMDADMQSPAPLSFSQLYTDSKYNFSFSYPANWQATAADSANGQLHTITLKSPNTFTTTATIGPTGIGGQCDIDPNKDLGYDVLLINNRTFYIHFTGDKAANTITNAYITQQTSPCPNIPFMSLPFTTSNSALIEIQMRYGDNTPMTKTEFQATEYQTAKYILSTLTI